jgi:hypothetical protein
VSSIGFNRLPVQLVATTASLAVTAVPSFDYDQMNGVEDDGRSLSSGLNPMFQALA